MKTKRNTPFSSTMELFVVDKKLDVTTAINNIFLTTDISLVEIALSGMYLAVCVNQYDKATLILLRNVLEAKLEMYLDSAHPAEYEQLVPTMREMISDVQNLIIGDL